MSERDRSFLGAWVTYLEPFRWVVPNNEDTPIVTLDEINTNNYDHGKLCRIAASFPSMNESYPLTVVCGDGAIASPISKQLPTKEAAVDHFSTVLSNLLLGGVYCEAIDQRDVATGTLHESRAIWPVNLGASLSSHLHATLRMRMAGSVERISLSSPKSIRVDDLLDAATKGAEIVSRLMYLGPQFITQGITEYYYRNWTAVVNNLWIVIEQLTEFLWREKFLKSKDLHPQREIAGRRTSLNNDNRTYTVAVKHEILYQSGIIDEECLNLLSPARQSRNKLAHEGKNCSEIDATIIFRGVEKLLKLSLDEDVDLSFSELAKHHTFSFEHTPENVPNEPEEDWKQIQKR